MTALHCVTIIIMSINYTNLVWLRIKHCQVIRCLAWTTKIVCQRSQKRREGLPDPRAQDSQETTWDKSKPFDIHPRACLHKPQPQVRLSSTHTQVGQPTRARKSLAERKGCFPSQAWNPPQWDTHDVDPFLGLRRSLPLIRSAFWYHPNNPFAEEKGTLKPAASCLNA